MGKYIEKDCTSKLTSFQHFFYNYGRFHGNTINILIHLIGIPILLITGYKLAELISLEYYHLPVNVGLILVSWMLVWLVKDTFSGVITCAQYLGIVYLLNGKDLSYGQYSSIQVLGAFHIAAWIFQFIGHGIFEQRAPALMTNIFLTINAPLFANLEILYYVFGYRKDDIEAAGKFIKEDIKAFNDAKLD